MSSAFRLNPSTVAIAALLAAAGQAHAQSAAAPAAPASAAADNGTQTVVIRASADASKGGLKAPYAGGQVARGGRVGILGSEDMMDTPFAITNYTQKLVQDQQAHSIADVLQNDAGVRMARGFGNFQQAYYVRGLPIFSDDMSYNGLYGLLPRQYLAAELVERVEVLHGASAFLNGAAPGGSGLGGAVNVAPKRATDAPLSEITLGVESGGQMVEAADFGRRFGVDKAFGVRLNAVNRDGQTAVGGESRKLNLFSLGVDFHTDQLRVSADLGYQDQRLNATSPSVTIAAGLAIPKAPDARHQLAQPWTFSEEKDTFGTLRAEYDFLPNVTGWAAGGFRQGEERNLLQGLTVGDAAGTENVSANANARHDEVGTGEVGLRGTFKLAGVKNTVVASAGIYELQSKNAYAFGADNVAAGTIYAPTFIATPDTTNGFVGGRLDNPLTTARTKTNSVAIADTIGFLDDKLQLTVGARRQRLSAYSYDYTTGAENDGGVNKTARVTPVAGLVFKASGQLSLYATYVEGLVAGDVVPAGFTGTPPVNVGQSLKPYVTKQGEIGAKLDLGRIGGTFSLFQSRKPTAGVDADTNVYRIITHVRNRGAEATFFGEIAPTWRILGGLSFLDTQESGQGTTGRHAIGAPRTQFNLGSEWDVPGTDGLTLDGRVLHTSTQFADAANTQVVPSWTRVDLGARYVIDFDNRAVTLRARVENVANRSYWASVGGYPGYGYLTVSTPRTLVVSGTVSF